MVPATDEPDVPVQHPVAEIPGAIEMLRGHVRERIVDERSPRLDRVVQVAQPDAFAAEVELTFHAQWNGIQLVI